MSRSFWKVVVLVALLFGFSGSLFVGCGPSDECKVNGDCIDSKGKGYTCTQIAGLKKCRKKGSKCLSVCRGNADCSTCDDGKTSCVAGVCARPGSGCPSSCNNHSDCAMCELGRTSCAQGICTSAKPVCPSSCLSDGDCKDCASGNNFCNSGTCGTKTQPPTCPATCASDDDCSTCGAGNTSCEGGKCGQKTTPTCPNTCTADADCAVCAANQKSCVSGQCSKKRAPSCPSSCSNDNDCAVCAADQKFCVSGQCGKKPTPTCPNACTADSDCSACSADQKFCVGGRCGKKSTPTCPNSCSGDGDCSVCLGGKNFCVNAICNVKPKPTCPSTCSADLDCAPCPGTNVSCQGGKCVTGGPVCPPVCTNTTQCSACGTGFVCGVQGKCQAPATPGVGQDCSQTNTCSTTGFICLQTQQTPLKASCFQDCGTNQNLCTSNTDGRTSCITVGTDQSGSAISICLAEVGVGKKCGFTGPLQARCKQNQVPSLYCSKSSVCKAVVVQKNVGGACNKQNDSTEPIKVCDGKLKLVCDEATAKCKTAIIAQEGEECDSTGANLGKQVLCDPTKKDLTCLRFDNTGDIQRCHFLCNPKASGQCAHRLGLTCAGLLSGGGGLCMDLTCTKDSECAFSKYKCSDSSSGGKICFPPRPVGPNKFGVICDTPTRTKGCTKGNFCLQEQGKTAGFCSIDCTTAGVTCPSAGTIVSSCQEINASTGFKACMFPCGQPGQSCPPGLKCNTSFNFCLAL